jgi:hypothetical protein
MAKKEPWKTHLEQRMRLVTVWFFGDVAYALLPLATIAIVRVIVKCDFTDFFSLKEWSFATIVFFGVTIRRLIRINADTPLSYKLDAGVQLFVLLLIGAVLVLAFVVLQETIKLTVISQNVVEFCQIILFLIGIGSIWYMTASEDRLRLRRVKLPRELGKAWMLRQIGMQFDRAYDVIWYINFGLDRVSELRDAEKPEDVREWREEQKRTRDLVSAVELLEELAAETRSNVERLINEKTISPVLPKDPAQGGLSTEEQSA